MKLVPFGRRTLTLLWLLLSLSFSACCKEDRPINFEIEKGILENDSLTITLKALTEHGEADASVNGEYLFEIDHETVTLHFTNGTATWNAGLQAAPLHLLEYGGTTRNIRLYYIKASDDAVIVKHIPLWLSILPPLVAILLALIFREVIVSLFAGIWAGAFIANGMSFGKIIPSLLNVMDKYVIQALMDTGHLSVIIFSLTIGGMVALISRNGGMAGIVNVLSAYARTARSSQMITWLMGVLIFFDDYANTLIVGNTMRPVTDRFKVSREKLAYLVDSTAAPVAAIAFITTWIGAELGYIGDAIDKLNIDDSAYSMFISSLAYAHYPVFTIFFMFLLIYMQRDYGSMYSFEVNARAGNIVEAEASGMDKTVNDLEPKAGVSPEWYNAFIPVSTVILVTLAGLFVTGYSPETWNATAGGFIQKLSATIGNSDSYAALLWSSLAGVFVAMILTKAGRIMSIGESMESVVSGFKAILPAVLILVSAWSLAILTEELHTATFLTHALLGRISAFWMPSLTFVLAAIISFSTGSSWSTMAILYPILLPTTWVICQSSGIEHAESLSIMHNVTAVILGGSVFGDHCSPISDTTILSSLASSCNHINHVKTQLPYAITVALISLFTGGILFYFAFPWWLSYLAGFVAIYLVIKFFGKPVPA